MSSLVKYFKEEMPGAFVSVPGTAGQLVGILDACLVNGFHSHTVTGSVVESGGTVTVTDTAHGFLDQQVVTIAGATPAGFNGDYRITRTGANTFTYVPASGTGAGSGTITAKTTSLGWTIAFTAANQRVYRAPAGNQYFLNIDDSNTATDFNCALACGFEVATAINTGTGQFPDTTVLGADHITRWMRPQFAGNGTSQVGWVIVGDDKRFFFGSPGYSTPRLRAFSFFGDFTSFLAGDTFNTLFGGDPSHGNGANYYYVQNFPQMSGQPTRNGANSFYPNELCFARGYDQATTSVNAGMWSAFAWNNGSLGSYNVAYSTASTSNTPNPITTGFDVTPLDLTERDTSSSSFWWRRGRMPGLLHVLGNPPMTVYADDSTIFTGVPQFGVLLKLNGAGVSNTSPLIFCLGLAWDSM